MTPPISSERELTHYLFKLRRYGIRLGLENMARLLNELDNPQERFASVHIAGTNGKGSTGALLASVAQKAGVRTGLYVSPHLISFRERIRVNGKWIPLAEVAHRVARLKPVIEKYHCTFFEVMTALAFDYFAAEKVELAVVETGLGGRLDATNILSPVLSLITEIDLDHMADLGSSVRDIAREKAGIIKQGVPLITSAHADDALQVLARVCAERKSPFHAVAEECRFSAVRTTVAGTVFSARTPVREYEKLTLNLLGRHQICNALTAIRAAELLKEQGIPIDEKAIREGLEKAQWRGRFEVLRRTPTVVLDIAHNPNGIRRLVQTFREVFPGKSAWLLMGVLADKDFETMVQEIGSIARRVLATAPDNPRALSPVELAQEFLKRGFEANAVRSVQEGIAFFLSEAKPNDILLITGSNYTVSDALSVLQGTEFSAGFGFTKQKNQLGGK